MNPNATLREIRELQREIYAKMSAAYDPWEVSARASELAEKVDDLDQWLSKGGCMPADWIPRNKTQELSSNAQQL